MIAYYRGHCIVVLTDEVLSAEISERASGEPLPTKVFGLPDDDASAVLDQAKTLVDTYLKHVELPERLTAQSASRCDLGT